MEADEGRAGGGGLPAPRRFGVEVERAICARVAAGESLLAALGGEGMPCYNTVMRWKTRRPAFAAALDAARREAGRPFGGKAKYCEATVEAILERLCDGEGIITMCKDPALPNACTVYRWMQARPEVREAVLLAREIHADRMAELGLAEAMAATPGTARVAEVRLRHLRWYAGRLDPVKYQAARASEPWRAAGRDAPPPAPPEPVVERRWCARAFWIETRADGWRRVRGSHPDPDTGRVVDEPPGEWEPPPPGSEVWRAEQEAAQRARAALWTGGPGAGSSEDPEGWL